MKKWDKQKIIDAILKRHKKGLKLDFKTVKKEDGSLAKAGYNYFKNWYTAIAAAGLDPEDIKLQHFCTIERIRKLIKGKAKCLSAKCDGHDDILKFECPKGHIWEMRAKGVLRGTKCKICSKTRIYTEEDMINLAKKRNGKYLSKTYKNTNTKVLWECEFGHQWEATPAGVIDGQWCRKCYCTQRAGASQRLTIDDMKKLAKTRKGKCLSKIYTNSYTKLKWKCNRGHTWMARPADVKNNNSWCPKCYKKTHLNEAKCRYVFEFFTGKKFPLDRKTLGDRLELDGYCEELKLAFEYQGEQHYQVIKHFKHTENDLILLQKHDKEKLEICRSKNITLIAVPFHLFRKQQEPEFIYKTLVENNIPIVKNLNEFTYGSFWSSDFRIKEAKKYAIKKGGKLLSNYYLGSKEKMEWQCEKGHTWEAAWNNMQHGQWCPKCCKECKRYKIDDMKQLALKREGECLSEKYINYTTHLKWRCKNGHTWFTSPGCVLNGSWCLVCAGKKRRTIEEMKEIAKQKGGECLSELYSSRQKLKWKCQYNHQWEAMASNVSLNGHWCSICAIRNSRKHN